MEFYRLNNFVNKLSQTLLGTSIFLVASFYHIHITVGTSCIAKRRNLNKLIGEHTTFLILQDISFSRKRRRRLKTLFTEQQPENEYHNII